MLRQNKVALVGVAITLLFLVILSTTSFALSEEGTREAQDDCLYYFYGEECVDCTEANLLVEDLNKKYPNLKVKEYEVYHDADNLALLSNYYNAYNVDASQQQVPVVFLLRTYLIGIDSMNDFLEQRILLNTDSTCPSLDHDEVIGILASAEPKNVMELLNFASITGTGVGNTVSNTSMAVVLIFLLLLIGLIKDRDKHVDEDQRLSVKDKKEDILRNSIIYIAIIYFMLLISGLGIGSFTFFSNKALFFSRFIALYGLVAGLVIMKQFLFEGHTIPRKYLKSIIPHWRTFRHYATTMWGFIIIALVASLFVAGSWDGQYQLLKKLLVESATLRWRVLPLFLWHNLLLLIPFTIVFAIAFWRLKKIQKIEGLNVQEHHLKLLVFLFASLAVLLGFFTLFYL